MGEQVTQLVSEQVSAKTGWTQRGWTLAGSCGRNNTVPAVISGVYGNFSRQMAVDN